MQENTQTKGENECREIYKSILSVLSKSASSSSAAGEGRGRRMETPVMGLWSELQRDNSHFLASSAAGEGRGQRMETPVMGLWSELQRDNRFTKGTLAANCESELQELMRQIDKLQVDKKKEWEREKEGLQSRLGIREKECQMQKSTLEQKHKEIGLLRHQLDSSEKKQRDLATQYESQLSQLRGEVQKLQREYERLHKRHVKQKKETEKEREKAVTDQQDSKQEIYKLTKKIEDYRQRYKDWEIERQGLQKQVENLEAQRRAIADKCEFVQQQAHTYQVQLDKRREILDSTEFSLKAQIAQLEAQLGSTLETLKSQVRGLGTNCKDISLKAQIAQLEAQLGSTSETLKSQNSKVDKLKTSLDDTLDAHKKAMDDNEKLLNDVKKANNQIRKLEEANNELQTELRAREDFLRISEEDSKQHEKDIAIFEKQISEKDDIIKRLSDSRDMYESEQLKSLKAQVRELEDQISRSRRNEELLVTENSQLDTELSAKRDECTGLNKKLEQKKVEVDRLEGELTDVKTQLLTAQSKLSAMSGSHESEVDAIKQQLEKVTSELHNRSSHSQTLTDRVESLDQQMRLEKEELVKREAELKVANAQIDALRLENRHLRQTIIQQTQLNLDHNEKESKMSELQDSYQSTIKTLEQENKSLKMELGMLQKEIGSMEDRFDQEIQRSLHETEMSFREELTKEQRRLQDIEEDADRRVSMLQDRLDSTINRYEEQLKLLRKQKGRLEDDLHQERRAGSSFVQPANVVYNEDDVLLVNDDMSLSASGSVDELIYEMPPLPPNEKFLIEENMRTRELEDIIDSHIEQLKSNTDAAIKKHS